MQTVKGITVLCFEGKFKLLIVSTQYIFSKFSTSLVPVIVCMLARISTTFELKRHVQCSSSAIRSLCREKCEG